MLLAHDPCQPEQVQFSKMPLRSPTHPAAAPIQSVDGNVQQEFINGLFSRDPTRVKETIGRYCHPDMKYSSHLAATDGRWNVWKLFYANNTLIETCIEHRASLVDPAQLTGIVWFDQLIRPNVPLVGGWLPEIRCPTFACITWVKQPDGGLTIMELQEHVSLDCLPNMLWPFGTWLQAHLVQPAGRLALEAVFEAANLATAVQVFAQKQFGGACGKMQ